MLKIGNIAAERGQRTSGWLSVPDGLGKSIDFPIVLIHGAKPGPVLWVNAGVHGTEYPGIEAAKRIAANFQPEDLKGSLVVIPTLNVPAFYDRSVYVCPLDGRNLNRVFPGGPKGTITEVLADYILREVAPNVTHCIDMHGGDMVELVTPFTGIRLIGDPAVDDATIALAKSYGIRKLIAIDDTATGWTGAGTLFANVALKGIPTLLTEAGGCGLLDEESTTILYDGVVNVMRHLEMISEPPVAPIVPEWFDEFAWIYTQHAGFFYPEVAAGDDVTAGQVVGTIRDFFGEDLERITSPVAGNALFIVTSPAVKAEGLLLGIGRASEPRA